MDTNAERRILLKRFFWKDRKIYMIGNRAGIPWFSQFDMKFARDQYAYFASEERNEAIEKIITLPSDKMLIDVLNEIGPDVIEIDRFVGEHYYFGADMVFKLENKIDKLGKDVRDALEETGNRGHYFLRAVIDLQRQGKWDRAYGGATWVDILAEIRKLGGKYPSPRDLAILKSYKIYYKTGSRRYPTHTVPEEMIPTVEAELEKWRKGTPS